MEGGTGTSEERRSSITSTDGGEQGGGVDGQKDDTGQVYVEIV